MKNIREVIEQAVRRSPAKEFLFYEDRKYTYEEMDRSINRAANGFLKMGIKKGDRVAVMMVNSPALVFVWLALNKIGASFAPINTAYKTLETEYIINNSEAKMIVVDLPLSEIVQKVQGCRCTSKLRAPGIDWFFITSNLSAMTVGNDNFPFFDTVSLWR